MNDELAADHVDIWITFAGRLVFPSLAWAMERVRCAMEADESFAVLDRVEKRLFPFLAHRRAVVDGALRGQITLRVEQKRVELRDVLRREDASVFRAYELPAMLSANRLENRLRVTRLAIFHLHDRMLKSDRSIEEQ